MITLYSMKDKRWADLSMAGTTGFRTLTFKEDGCLICSIAIIDGRTPLQINNILLTGHAFDNNAEILDYVAAKILGYTYQLLSPNDNVKYPCIAETDHYKRLGYPQHFFVMTDKTHCVDPLMLPAVIENNPYNIVSFRQWTKIGA